MAVSVAVVAVVAVVASAVAVVVSAVIAVVSVVAVRFYRVLCLSMKFELMRLNFFPQLNRS